MRSLGDPDVNESGRTESMAAAMVALFDGLSLLPCPSLTQASLSEDRRSLSWPSS